MTVSTNGREVYVGQLSSEPGHALHKFELSKQKGFEEMFDLNIFILDLFFLELPTQTFIKKIYDNDKNFRISLIIMAAFAIPVLLAVIVGCCIRIRNIRT